MRLQNDQRCDVKVSEIHSLTRAQHTPQLMISPLRYGSLNPATSFDVIARVCTRPNKHSFVVEILHELA